MSEKLAAVGLPLMLALVLTSAFWNLKQSSLEKGSRVILNAIEPSCAMRLCARFTALSRMMVVGFVAKSSKSQATLGTFRTYLCSRASESTKHIIALESSRCLI